jgi:glycosyltransferase involved in cell wall biosynthesis
MSGTAHGISVVICCYNSAGRIGPTLQHVLSQSAPVPWEVIVVDNNSTDRTRQVAEAAWQESGMQVPFRVVDEKRPGLTSARECGFAHAIHPLILLVDDDNHLAQGYLATVADIMGHDASIGILGGLAEAVLDAAPPAWYTGLGHVHATGAPWGVGGTGLTEADAVYGAGMTLRRSVLDRLQAARFVSQLSDRKGSALSSGGDTELCLAARLAGFRVMCSDRLRFLHLIPSGRVEWGYMCRLYKGFGRAKAYIDIYHHVLAGRAVPSTDGRIPYWADRFINLLKELFSSQRLSLFGLMTGTGPHLRRLETMAHIELMREVVQNRRTYMAAWAAIGALTHRLKELP